MWARQLFHFFESRHLNIGQIHDFCPQIPTESSPYLSPTGTFLKKITCDCDYVFKEEIPEDRSLKIDQIHEFWPTRSTELPPHLSPTDIFLKTFIYLQLWLCVKRRCSWRVRIPLLENDKGAMILLKWSEVWQKHVSFAFLVGKSKQLEMRRPFPWKNILFNARLHT